MVIESRTRALRQPALLLDHVDCDFRAIGFGKPSLVFKVRRDNAVTGFVGVAVFVQLEKLRRECLTARMALAFVRIDVNPQSLCHGGFLGRMHAARRRRVPLVNIVGGIRRFF